MNNLDDFMRHKFEDDDATARFDFQEEFWLEAQALIEKEEARKKEKKRRRFLFLMGSTALLGLLGLFCWCTKMRLGNSQTGKGTTLPNGIAVQKNKEEKMPSDPAQPVSENAGNNPIGLSNNGETSQGNLVGNDKDSKQGHSAPNTNGIQNNIDQKQSKSSTRDNENNLNQRSKSSTYFNANTRSDRPTVADTPAATAAHHRSESTPENTENTTKNSPNVPFLTNSTADTPNFNPSEGSGISGKTDNPTDLTLNQNAILNPETPQKITQKLLLPDLNLLPMKVQFLPKTAPKLPKKFQKPIALVPKTNPDKRFSLGLTGAYAYGFDKNNGYLMGICGKYRLNDRFSLHAGAQFRHTNFESVDSSLSMTSEDLRYSFGYILNQYYSEPTRLNCLELPMTVQARWRSLAFEAGLAPTLRLSTYGKQKLLQSTQLSTETMDKGNSRVKISESPYKSAYVSLLGGVQWQFARDWSLGLRCSAQPKGVLNSDAVNASKWSSRLEVGIQWYFFSK